MAPQGLPAGPPFEFATKHVETLGKRPPSEYHGVLSRCEDAMPRKIPDSEKSLERLLRAGNGLAALERLRSGALPSFGALPNLFGSRSAARAALAFHWSRPPARTNDALLFDERRSALAEAWCRLCAALPSLFEARPQERGQWLASGAGSDWAGLILSRSEPFASADSERLFEALAGILAADPKALTRRALDPNEMSDPGSPLPQRSESSSFPAWAKAARFPARRRDLWIGAAEAAATRWPEASSDLLRSCAGSRSWTVLGELAQGPVAVAAGPRGRSSALASWARTLRFEERGLAFAAAEPLFASELEPVPPRRGVDPDLPLIQRAFHAYIDSFSESKELSRLDLRSTRSGGASSPSELAELAAAAASAAADFGSFCAKVGAEPPICPRDAGARPWRFEAVDALVEGTFMARLLCAFEAEHLASAMAEPAPARPFAERAL